MNISIDLRGIEINIYNYLQQQQNIQFYFGWMDRNKIKFSSFPLCATDFRLKRIRCNPGELGVFLKISFFQPMITYKI